MEDEIKKISSGEIQNHLLKKWKKDTDEEEEKSEYIWTKKKVFYDYTENYGTVELDRNEKPAQNKSLKPRSRYQHGNDKTYADVTMEKKPINRRDRGPTIKHLGLNQHKITNDIMKIGIKTKGTLNQQTVELIKETKAIIIIPLATGNMTLTTMKTTTTTTIKTTTAIKESLFCGGAKFRNTAGKVGHSKNRPKNNQFI